MSLTVKLFFILCFAMPDVVHAQNECTLKGNVFDAETKLAIPYATVFLANSMIGAYSGDDGFYTLSKIPPGKYQLTVSCVGYKVKNITVLVSEKEMLSDIFMEHDVQNLKEVVVKSSRAEYERQLNIFRTYFLGTTRNSLHCRIKNITDVEFNYDYTEKVLTASCDKPLEIENKALGYRVFYLLEEFKMDYKKGYCFIMGIPRFQNMEAKNKREPARWSRERKRAYYGSMNHFMRSLKTETLADNKFSIYLLSKKRPSKDFKFESFQLNDSLYYAREIHEADLQAKDYSERCFLKIIYSAEQPEQQYPRRAANTTEQISYLKFMKHKLVIYDNGYYEDPLSYYSDGYLAWANKVSELLPTEYQP